MQLDINWFKQNIAPLLGSYQLDYKQFENGDFGDLTRVDIEGKIRSGSIDFWSSGWVGIHIYDFEIEKEMINVLLEPEQDQVIAFEELKKLLVA